MPVCQPCFMQLPRMPTTRAGVCRYPLSLRGMQRIRTSKGFPRKSTIAFIEGASTTSPPIRVNASNRSLWGSANPSASKTCLARPAPIHRLTRRSWRTAELPNPRRESARRPVLYFQVKPVQFPTEHAPDKWQEHSGHGKDDDGETHSPGPGGRYHMNCVNGRELR